MADVKVDYKSVENLEHQVRFGFIVSLGRLGERGYQLLRREVPEITGNLRQGVATPDIDESAMTATLTVSARSDQRGGGQGTIHYENGKTKPVNLKPQIAFNYAEVVAKGRPEIKPKTGRALLIEVTEVKDRKSYITAGGKTFIVARSAAAVAANPYDERAAQRLNSESGTIVGAVFGELFN